MGVKSYYLDLRPTPGEEIHAWYCKLSQEPVSGEVTALGESASITFIKGQSLKLPPRDLSLYPRLLQLSVLNRENPFCSDGG